MSDLCRWSTAINIIGVGSSIATIAMCEWWICIDRVGFMDACTRNDSSSCCTWVRFDFTRCSIRAVCIVATMLQEEIPGDSNPTCISNRRSTQCVFFRLIRTWKQWWCMVIFYSQKSFVQKVIRIPIYDYDAKFKLPPAASWSIIWTIQILVRVYPS